MNKLFLLFIIILLLNNCSKDKETVTSIISEDEIQAQMIESYEEGMASFKDKFYFEAAKKFNEAELLFPQSEWAPRASLMAAYSYYLDDYNNDAKSELKIFFKK